MRHASSTMHRRGSGHDSVLQLRSQGQGIAMTGVYSLPNSAIGSMGAFRDQTTPSDHAKFCSDVLLNRGLRVSLKHHSGGGHQHDQPDQLCGPLKRRCPFLEERDGRNSWSRLPPNSDRIHLFNRTFPPPGVSAFAHWLVFTAMLLLPFLGLISGLGECVAVVNLHHRQVA